jgi:hypothetical protein
VARKWCDTCGTKDAGKSSSDVCASRVDGTGWSLSVSDFVDVCDRRSDNAFEGARHFSSGDSVEFFVWLGCPGGSVPSPVSVIFDSCLLSLAQISFILPDGLGPRRDSSTGGWGERRSSLRCDLLSGVVFARTTPAFVSTSTPPKGFRSNSALTERVTLSGFKTPRPGKSSGRLPEIPASMEVEEARGFVVGVLWLVPGLRQAKFKDVNLSMRSFVNLDLRPVRKRRNWCR